MNIDYQQPGLFPIGRVLNLELYNKETKDVESGYVIKLCTNFIDPLTQEIYAQWQSEVIVVSLEELAELGIVAKGRFLYRPTYTLQDNNDLVLRREV